MFDWHFLRGVTVDVAMLAVVLGIFVALPLMLTATASPFVHGLAAIDLV
jgi:hypothetical protein